MLRLTEVAVRSIDIWRAVLCMRALDETRFARPFSTFVPKASARVVQFDASLEGAGVMVYERNPTSGMESLLGAGVAPLTSLNCGTYSSFQNTSEFLAATIGVLTCLLLEEADGTPVVVDLRGDSKTALH